jgi:hypothetical protein
MPDFKLVEFFQWKPGNNWREPKEAEQFFNICKDCPNLKLDDKFCSKCFCYIPKKVYYKHANCPIGKW